MTQRWRDLTFLHFPAEVAEIQALLPEGLTVDTYPDESGEERAWVGLVPFRMEGVRPRWMPGIGSAFAFAETNVRTYVHSSGGPPGVWFFSLEAANRLACSYARRVFRLPYWHAEMTVLHRGDIVEYGSRRFVGDAHCAVRAAVGDERPRAEPGSLDFFLVERYLLYAHAETGFATGRVYHKPYPLRTAEVRSCDESLTLAAGIPPGAWEHVVYSPGVDVEVFSLEPLE